MIAELDIYQTILDEYQNPFPNPQAININKIIIGLMKMLKQDNSDLTREIIKNSLLLSIPILRNRIHTNEKLFD